jgi:N-acetylglucosaminyl-diphospho-decaprenol L-rhamnosyltransferase
MKNYAIPAQKVTVSIVSHAQWKLVEPLLQQLKQCCSNAIARVVITLNVPEVYKLNDQWPFEVKLIKNLIPQGFGANHNAAFQHCQTEWFLVLNPDIRFRCNVIGELLNHAGYRSGLLSLRIQEPEKNDLEPHRYLPTPAELLRRRLPKYHAPSQPDWVGGMFMLLRKDAFHQLGGFDTRFYMYCEDVDLCARLRLAGWRIQVNAEFMVIHDAQRASQKSLRPLIWHLSSLIKLWSTYTFWKYRSLLNRERRSEKTSED